MSQRIVRIGLLAAAAGFFGVSAQAADALQNRTIGFVITDATWAIYQSPDGKEECPQGTNQNGPREAFKSLFNNQGSVAQTELLRESTVWFPKEREDQVPFLEATGSKAIGLNLDGKIGAHDFVSPEGVRGVDNQLFRAIGCLDFFRGPTGVLYIFSTKYLRDFDFDRALMELTNVDDLQNDPDVDVTFYRGLDRLMTDASGEKIVPGGSQRIDARFGKKFIAHAKGKIVDGVLTTDPVDVYWPWAIFPRDTASYQFKGARLQVKITPEGAEGVLGGYADVDNWYQSLISSYSTHHLGYGRVSAPGLYRALRRNADAYPDASGANTAISFAITVKYAQAFLQHPTAEPQVSSTAPAHITASSQR
jgi:hypothetical protein